jgi:hypothetical protein
MRALVRSGAPVVGLVILEAFFVLVLVLGVAYAEKVPPAEVPDAIKTRPDEEVVLLARATGSQIYICQSLNDGKFSWTLKAPDAELKDQQDKVIGSHFAGPSWKLKDGSEVTGKASAHVDSEDPNSIPWLLVGVVTHSGTGLLTNVTAIQRVHTHGGKPPGAGCDEPHRGAETSSTYSADYYFYAPTK